MAKLISHGAGLAPRTLLQVWGPGRELSRLPSFCHFSFGSLPEQHEQGGKPWCKQSPPQTLPRRRWGLRSPCKRQWAESLEPGRKGPFRSRFNAGRLGSAKQAPGAVPCLGLRPCWAGRARESRRRSSAFPTGSPAPLPNERSSLKTHIKAITASLLLRAGDSFPRRCRYWKLYSCHIRRTGRLSGEPFFTGSGIAVV